MRIIAVAALAVALCCCGGGSDGLRDLILVTTTSTYDSGLLDKLIPIFERDSGYRVKVLAVGTGQALAMAARGEADAAFVHAPQLEQRYMAQGVFTQRRAVMHNDFVIVGPAIDAAGIGGTESAAAALARIAAAGSAFVSRGDSSGTHFRELEIWRASGTAGERPWYIEAGQGMGASLMIALEKQAYILTDRGTYLAFRQRTGLQILVEGDPVLLNPYHIMTVDARRFPKVNVAAATAFAEFLVSSEVQTVIADFGRERFGMPLFFADAV